ncbi:hypothetical protein U3516DRAFT_742348 [Neocallimastix sp. 'constans']
MRCNVLTVIMVRRRRSPLPLHKQRNSRKKHSTRSSKGKAEPTTGGVLAIPEELETKTYLPEYHLTPSLSRNTQREKSLKI